MEQINSINPHRIQWCCDDLKTTPEAVALELGIPGSKMQTLMAGNGSLTFSQLTELASYFGRGVFFFLEAGRVDELKVHTAQFRTIASQKPDLSARFRTFIERVEKQRQVFLGLNDEGDKDESSRFQPPVLSGKSIEQAAGITRQWLGLGQRNSFDSYREAIEAKGILVFKSNGYAGKWQVSKDSPILGFNLFDPVCPVIVVKKLESEGRQAFTLMHELGHVLLHRVSSIDDGNDMSGTQGMEREANQFAGFVLVPTQFLNSIPEGDWPSHPAEYDSWLKEYRNAWSVSTEMILRRLLDVGRLDGAACGAYREWLTTLPPRIVASGGARFRYKEPKQVFGDRFVRRVFDALNARQITLSKASDYLDGLKVKDIHQLKATYASA